MNELAHHIKVLLLEHNHVALPQFGTFFTDTTVTGRVDDEAFAPVRCSLHFTPEIDDADNHLAQSLMKSYRLSQEQAEAKLQRLLAEASTTLASTNILDFGALGQFNLNGGRITFSPCTAGLIVPEYYGLDAVGMEVLPKLATQQGTGKHDEKREEASYVIQLNRNVVHYVASIAAAVLLFFFFNTPLGDFDNQGFTHSDLTGMLVPHVNHFDWEGLAEQPEFVEQETEAQAEVAAEAEPEVAVAQAPKTEPAEAKESAACAYTIVLASDVSKRGANDYVSRLAAAGYSEARVETGKMTRVVYGSFASEEEARKAQVDLKQRDSQFASCWILKK